MLFFATTPFSMEKPVRNQLERMNIKVTGVSEGRVYFEGGYRELAEACVNLRSADRVFREITSFSAHSFDELFDGVSKVKWVDIISKNGKINVSAKCARSQLMSVSDVQRITKTAIIKSLQRKYKIDRFPEKGEEYPIEVHINRDVVTVALDCCGVSLHKRGYRVKNAVAPLRETFAAGLLDICGYRGNTPFCDPFCGSGTLPIEAALKALNIAPGVKRGFAAEHFLNCNKKEFDEARVRAKNAVRDVEPVIYCSDISGEMTDMTRFHAQRAGVGEFIHASVCSAKDSIPRFENGIIVTNPPYGERIGDEKYMLALCDEIKIMLDNYSGWNCNILSGYKSLEKHLSRHAEKARRFYNGNIECGLYTFLQKK